ncbi:MAG: RNA polymerase sigma factor [Thermoguttaceae bacterium]
MSVLIESLQKAQNGDKNAFSDIVRQYQGLVAGVVFAQIGDFHRSEEITQEAFLTAWQELPKLQQQEQFPAWICTIARNLAKKSFRPKQAKIDAAVSQFQNGIITERVTTATPETEAMRHEQSRIVWNAVSQMPEAQREAIILFYRSGNSVHEIAEITGVSEDAIRQRLVRARSTLREKLESVLDTILTTTSPGETFTMAVIAALPAAVIATTTGCAVGTTAVATSGSGLTGKVFGFTGISLLTWLVGVTWIGFTSILIPLASLFGGFHVILTQVQNTPTIRSRRFLMRDCLFRTGTAMFLMGAYFFVSSLPNSVLSLYGKIGTIMILALLFFSNIVFAAIFTNQLWRKIIEEDTGLRPAPELPLEKSWLSDRALRLTFGISFSMLCIGLAGFMYFVGNLSLGFPSGVFQKALFYGFLLLQILPIGLFINTYRQTMKMVSQSGLEKYPPTIPNILDIVLGKAEMPKDKKTLRGRMGGDMLGMGILIFGSSTQPVMMGLMQSNPFPGYLVIAVSLIGFLLFAVFVAGKPKIRHLGYMLTSWLFAAFYAWILWGGIFQTQFNAIPSFELAVLFIYVLFFFSGLAGFCGYIGLFEKEINLKLGTPSSDSTLL